MIVPRPEDTDASIDAIPIRIRHYGPISFADGTTPVNIKCLVGDDSTFMDVEDCFEFEITSDEPTVLKATPSVILPNASEWQITPTANLKSDLTGNPAADPPVASYTYEFCVGTTGEPTLADKHECEADVDGSGTIDNGDLTRILFLFTDPNVTPCTRPAGDVNEDGVTNFDDLTSTLFVFQKSCVSCDGSMQAMSGGGSMAANFVEPPVYPSHCEELLNRFGFDTFTEYLAYVDTLTEEEQLEEAALVVTTVADILQNSSE
jgi:hypothetical protein